MASKSKLNLPMQEISKLAKQIGMPSDPNEIRKIGSELNTQGIHRIRSAIQDVFQSVNQYDSPLDWLAKTFALLPPYLKIPLGFAITGSAFLITNPFFAGIAALGGLIFVLITVLLDMHASRYGDKSKLMDFLSSSVGEMVESIFVHLAYQAFKLEQEVQKFTEQNSKLAAEIDKLQVNITSLDKELSELKKINTTLQETCMSQKQALNDVRVQEQNLKVRIGELKLLVGQLTTNKELQEKAIAELRQNERALREIVEQQKVLVVDFEATKLALIKSSEQLKATETQLDNVRVELKSTAKALDLSAKELLVLKEKSALEIRNLKLVNQALRSNIETLSNALVEDETKRNQFLQRLDGFLSDSNKELHSISERICQAERELSETKAQLQQETVKYSDLLKIHEHLVKKQDEQVRRLETIRPPTKRQSKMVASIADVSLFLSAKPLKKDISTQTPGLRETFV
ncbi:hypothetical protein [Legionella impletisoli]|uniref:Inclusion membrane protein A n=1 Tax=Legionella impletisoli TaxID=343510 RepID=A0A917JR29_9GAMM|nr:hypothetical protein [Legionella impletisoli]GGI82391.1 hypothetical protein GCM10007966_08720 [Legionella impletisoli]